jgi:hypothetical protein
MAKTNLASMSIDALLTLRSDIERTLGRKAAQLKEQLSRLGDEAGGYKKKGRGSSLIPNPIDQNPWAHWRSPMDMMRQGRSTSLFHAAQQWSTRSS